LQGGNPLIEENNDAFQKFAFDSHVPSYENAGLFDLPIRDLFLIGTTPDMKDLLSSNGREQIRAIAKDYIVQAKEKPASTTYKWLIFALQLYQTINKK
jgi:hypothetical protein